MVCKLYRKFIEPFVTWVFLLFGIRLKKWQLAPLQRQSPSSTPNQKLVTFKNGKRVILCCDGGGVRGIVTLHCLKALEERLDSRCIDIFDMFAGSSTGAIIAGSLAYGISVDDLIKLYQEKHPVMFTKTLLGWTKLIIPKYRSEPPKYILKSIFQDDTLKESVKDLFITAKDTVRSETIYFTAFHEPGTQKVHGTYKDVKFREAIAASAISAPTYFDPVGRFIDGGVGSFNNVSYVAPVEAMRYSTDPVVDYWVNDHGVPDPKGKWPVFKNLPENQFYKPGEMMVLSFGTGRQINNMEPGEASRIKTSFGWINWLIGDGFDDASKQQTYISGEELAARENGIRFRRYQIHFTDEAIAELQNIDSSLPLGVDYSNLDLDAIEYFDYLDKVGAAFGKWLKQNDRFNLESVELGDPLVVRQPEFNITVYAQEVKKELKKANL
ncbi:MAG: patatin-like phospholipase family protein [Nitrospiria bacterium]